MVSSLALSAETWLASYLLVAVIAPISAQQTALLFLPIKVDEQNLLSLEIKLGETYLVLLSIERNQVGKQALNVKPTRKVFAI